LKKLNVCAFIYSNIKQYDQSFPKVTGAVMLSRTANSTLNEKHCEKMNDEFVSIEHLVLAIFNSKSKAGQILKDQG
jgi:ATP-dependent Clp protease ATP-binding subunit ClpB